MSSFLWISPLTCSMLSWKVSKLHLKPRCYRAVQNNQLTQSNETSLMSAIWSSMSLNLVRICQNGTMMFSIWCMTTTATTTTLPRTTTTQPTQICMRCCHATSLQLAPAAASDWGSHPCCHISFTSSYRLLLFIVAVSEKSDKQGQQWISYKSCLNLSCLRCSSSLCTSKTTLFGCFDPRLIKL